MDLFVANDTVPNFLFVNRAKASWDDIGSLVADVAYSEFGRARSGMGVDAADYQQDGWIDLFVANVNHEMLFALPQQQETKPSTMSRIQPGIGAGNPPA